MALPTKIIVTGAAQGIGRAVALRLGRARRAYRGLGHAGKGRRGNRAGVPGRRRHGACLAGRRRRCRPGRGCGRGLRARMGRAGRPRQQCRNFSARARARYGAFGMGAGAAGQPHRDVLCARAVAARMKDAGRGAIVNTASGRALAGAANGAHYCGHEGRHHRADQIAGARLGGLRHPGQLHHSGHHRHGAAAR